MLVLKFQHRVAFLLGLVVLGGASIVGCGSETPGGIVKVPVVPTSAKVLFEGEPIDGALVVLHPKSGADAKAIPARGNSGTDGVVKLTTYNEGDGVAIGEFAVTVELRPLVENGEARLPGPNVLPERYASPQTTDLVIRVAKGDTDVKPLNLTR